MRSEKPFGAPQSSLARDRLPSPSLVEGAGFTYNGSKPTGGSIDSIGLGGVLQLGFEDIPLATFVQLASTPKTLVERIFSGDDFLFGSYDADRLSGFPGGDAFLGGGGIDIIDGGSGADIASYVGTVVPVRVTLNGSSFVRVTLGGVAEDQLFSRRIHVGTVLPFIHEEDRNARVIKHGIETAACLRPGSLGNNLGRLAVFPRPGWSTALNPLQGG